MTATEITKNNIDSAPYNNIFDVINTRSNVNDPRDVENKKTRKFVYDSDPFENAIDFSYLPYIILFPQTHEYENNVSSVNGQCKRVGWSHRIIVRTVREGSGNSGTDIGRTDIQSISDDLISTFNDDTIRGNLNRANMQFMNLNKIDSDSTTIEDRDVYEVIFELSYETRLKVF